MNLLLLKKQVKTAKRGHKLLKDKRDGLMKTFMEIIREVRELRTKVETEIGSMFAHFLAASVMTSNENLENALMLTTTNLDLDVSTKNVMSVHVPKISVNFSGNAKTFSPVFTSGELDAAIEKLQEIFPVLIQLSEIEKAVELLADEIEKTRRRVNALEYRRIPDLEDTVRFITMKLEEMARDALVSVMRIKKMIEAKESENSR